MGKASAKVIAMASSRFELTLALEFSASGDGIVGAAAPNQADLGVVEMQRQGVETREVLRDGLQIAEAQADRIVGKPDTVDADWHAKFPPTRAGIVASKLIDKFRGKSWRLNIAGTSIDLGGKKNIPRFLPTGESFPLSGYVPYMVDGRRGKVELEAAVLDDAVEFDLTSPGGPDRIKARVLVADPRLLRMLKLASAVDAAVDVLLARYRSADAKRREMLVIQSVTNAESIRSSASRFFEGFERD